VRSLAIRFEKHRVFDIESVVAEKATLLRILPEADDAEILSITGLARLLFAQVSLDVPAQSELVHVVHLL